MATAQVKSAPQFGDAMPEPKKYTRIPREAIRELSFEIGNPFSVVVPGAEMVEEGPQDTDRWQDVGSRLAMYQWVRVTNQAGSFRRFMEVERIHTAPGSGLRALVLRDLFPPRFYDLTTEPIVATGEWYVRHSNNIHQKWIVVRPNGTIAHGQINSEAEARTICHREAGNPRPVGS